MIPAVTTFTAVLVTQEDGKSAVSLQTLDRTALRRRSARAHRLFYLNYKDGLAVT